MAMAINISTYTGSVLRTEYNRRRILSLVNQLQLRSGSSASAGAGNHIDLPASNDQSAGALPVLAAKSKDRGRRSRADSPHILSFKHVQGQGFDCTSP